MVAAEGDGRITLSGSRLTVTVELRGGVISRLSRPEGDNLLAEWGWTAPVPTSRTQSYLDDELDFLADYHAGWHELFPNAGGSGEVLGTPIPFHGDVARSAWHVVGKGEDHLTMTCPTRLPVVLTRHLRISGDSVLLEEEAHNESPLVVPVLWGHHPVFPAAPGMRIDLPSATFTVDPAWAPRYADLPRGASGRWPTLTGHGPDVDLSTLPAGAAERLVFLTDLEQTWGAVRDPQRGWGVAYAWDGQTFPNAWYWLQVGGEDFPWFGRAAYVALEPQSTGHAAGLAHAAAQGEALILGPHARRRTWLTMTVLADPVRPVLEVGRSGRVRQG